MFITHMVRIIALSLGLATCITQPMDRLSWPKIDPKILKTSLIGSVAGACVYAISCLTSKTPVKSSYALGTMGLFGLVGAAHTLGTTGLSALAKATYEYFYPKCAICMEQTPLFNLSCGHTLACSGCLKIIIETAATSKQVIEVRCPEIECKKELSMEDIQAITNQKTAENIADIKTQEALKKDPQSIHCPTPNCTMIYTNDRNELRTINCSACKKSYCSKCRDEHHPAFSTCEDYKKTKKVAQDEAAFKKWKQENTKECPKCNVAIEKKNGCAHIKCAKCQHDFCWDCGKQYIREKSGKYVHINNVCKKPPLQQSAPTV